MDKTPRVGIVRDDRYLDHVPNEGHPDTPQRLAHIHRMLDNGPLGARLVSIPPRPVTQEQMRWVHSADHIDRLAATAGRASRALSADTPVSPGSFTAARLAAGGLISAVDRVVAGELTSAFALVRPPGHHAEKNRAMGYCLLNNVAIGAMYARRTLGLERVLVLDWDVHHGNGTQHAFERNAAVLFISMHQYPHFPGTGHFTETGIGPGEGYTVNLAMPRGCGDAEYAALLRSLVCPLAEAFAPQLILVSAGFDSHAEDPLGAMRMSASGFARLTCELMKTAGHLCRGRLVLCLEGGYHSKALTDSVRAVLEALTGTAAHQNEPMERPAPSRKATYVHKRVVSVHRRFWNNLAAANGRP